MKQRYSNKRRRIIHSNTSTLTKVVNRKEKITREQLALREIDSGGLRRNVIIFNDFEIPIHDKQSFQLSAMLSSSIGLIGKVKTKQAWLDSREIINHTYKQTNKIKKIKCPTNIKCLLVLMIASVILAAILTPVLVVSMNRKPVTTTTRAPRTALLRWNSTGITVAGVTDAANNTAIHLNTPWGLTLDWANTLYVSDRNNSRIQKFIRNSSIGITVAGRSDGVQGRNATEFNETNSVIVDWADNLYVSDRYNDRVQCWYKDTSFGVTIAGISNFGGSSLERINGPAGMARDHSTGFLYVVDQNNDRVMAYRYENITGDVAAGGNGNGTNPNQLNNPTGLHYDVLTNGFYIANTASNNIVRWTIGETRWNLVLGDVNGSAGDLPSLLRRPMDVTMDPMGNIYVADRGNQRVQFLPVGATNATTIAGKLNSGGKTAVLFRQPAAVALDSQLNLYVADSRNHRIQKFYRY